jgi:hypothetical protein
VSPATINIVSATQVGEHRLKIEFDDKTVQEIDFGHFLKRARHPDVRAYLQPERFSAFHIEYGELIWGDYDLCFPVIDLYRNTIEHAEMMAHAA